MHWMQAERFINKLGLNSSAIRKEKLETAEIFIRDRCKSLLKAYHPDTGIESKSKKFQEISNTIQLIEKFGIPIIYKALNESPKRISERKETLEKIDEKLKISLKSGSLGNLSELKEIFESGKYFLDLLKYTKNNYMIITNLAPLYREKPITIEDALKDVRMKKYFSEELIKIGKRETKRKLSNLENLLIKNKKNREEAIEQEKEFKGIKDYYSFLEEEHKKSKNHYEFQKELSNIQNKEADIISEDVTKIIGSQIWNQIKEIKKEENKNKKFYGLDLLIKENFAEHLKYKSFKKKFDKIDRKEYQKINEFLIADLNKKKNKEIFEKIKDRIHRKKLGTEKTLNRLEKEINLSYGQEIKMENEKENLKNLDIEKEYTLDKKFDKIKKPLKMISEKIKENSTPEEIKLFETRTYSKKFIDDSDKPRYSTIASISFDEELNIHYHVFKNLSDKFVKNNGNYEPTNRKIFGIISLMDLEKNDLRKINTFQLKGEESSEKSDNLIYKETIRKLSFFNDISNNAGRENTEGNYALVSVEFKENQPIYRNEGIVASNFFKDFSIAITRNAQK